MIQFLFVVEFFIFYFSVSHIDFFYYGSYYLQNLGSQNLYKFICLIAYVVYQSFIGFVALSKLEYGGYVLRRKISTIMTNNIYWTFIMIIMTN